MTLTQTKTTGPGKKVKTLKAYVARDSWLARRDWLVIGFRLWEAWSTDRQHFLLMPNVVSYNTYNIMILYYY